MPGDELEGKQEGNENGSSTDPPAPKSVALPLAPPPFPPGAQQAPLVAFAQQIIQSPGSLNDFSPEIQRMLIEGLQTQDKFSYELACKNIDHEDKLNEREVGDRARGRNQLLILVAGILLIGGVVDFLLLYKGQYQLATQLLTYGGTALISALGGFGLGRTKTFGGGKSE